jgi:hypothetical protein
LRRCGVDKGIPLWYNAHLIFRFEEHWRLTGG